MEYHQTSTAETYSFTYIVTDVNEVDPITNQDANNKPNS